MARPGHDQWEPYQPPVSQETSEPEASRGTAESGGKPKDPEDESALWERWRGKADGAARSLLVQRYMPFAKALAARFYARRPNDEVEFDEYRQFAMVGLVESVDRYQPDKGARFKTFAMPRIQGAILNGLERLTERRQQYAWSRRLAAERTASLKPQALSLEATQRLLEQLEEIGVGVALGLLLEGTGMVVGPQEGLPENAYTQIEMRQVHQHLWEMVKHLTDRERDVIHMHYRELNKFDKIAETLQITPGRVSQLHRQAIERLRTLITKAAKCDVVY